MKLFANDGQLRAYVDGPDRESWLRLVSVDGEPSRLILRTGGGDCDTISWPFQDGDVYNLAMALYDEGNMGYFSPGPVTLPDGRLFGQLLPGGFELDSAFHSEFKRRCDELDGDSP